MITITIADLIRVLDGKDNHLLDLCASIGCGLYVVREGDLIIYIGKSGRGILDRMAGHLGKGSFGWGGLSILGHFILENLPAALAWQVDLLTPKDALDKLEKLCNYRREVMGDGSSKLIVREFLWPDGSGSRSVVREDNLDGIEDLLIEVSHPCLNIMGNKEPTPLPEQYQQAIYGRS